MLSKEVETGSYKPSMPFSEGIKACKLKKTM